MYPWKTVLQLDVSNSRPKYLQIADKLIKEISLGHLQQGAKIPSTRKMALTLNLNRKTVILAYEELIAQGWLQVKPSSGTFISDDLPVTHHSKITREDGIAANATHLPINRYSFIPTYFPTPPKTIVLDGGSPDPRLAPIDWLYKECRSVVKSRNGHKLSSYSDVHGDLIFRQTLAKYLSETRGINVKSSNILITRGSQMGIFITMSTILKNNEIAIVGSSSYDAADWTIQYCGGQLKRITVDNEGIDTNELEQFCKQYTVKIIYITPHHHFPTTVTLSSARRVHLLQLAVKYNFFILEDDYDYDFHYDSNSILPLASLNPGGRVIYIGSFSKVLAANIRMGYLVCDDAYIEEFSKIRRIIDRQGDHVMQRALSAAINTGEITRHLKKCLITYRKRRDHLAALLEQHLAHHVTYKIPEGGMSIWVKFNEIPLVDLEPLIKAEGLHMDIDVDLAKKYNALRIGFASVNEKEMTTAIEILTNVVRQLSS